MASEISNFIEVSSQPTKGNFSGFSSALSIWINKPHVVNRRLCGTKFLSVDSCSKVDFETQLVFDKLKQLGYKLNDEDQFNSVENKQENVNQEHLNSVEDHFNVSEKKQEKVNPEHVGRETSNGGDTFDRNDNVPDLTVQVNDIDSNFDAESRCTKCGAGASHSVSDSQNDKLGERIDLEGCNSIGREFRTKKCDANSGISHLGDNSGKKHQNLAENESVNDCDIIVGLTGSENERTLMRDSQLVNNFGENKHSDRLQRHAKDDILQIEGLADFREVVIIIRELVPKQPDRHQNIPELIIYDKSCKKCTFYPISRTENSGQVGHQHRIEVAYQFCYTDLVNDTAFTEDTHAKITLSVSCTNYSEDSSRKLSLTWLQGQLLPKLARWSEEPNLKTSLTSLKLVPLEEYNALYNDLKIKYGQHFAKVWPEKTDPQKYVYEDVAIATYLLLLWKQDREKKGLRKKQSFVDLGCGNGLLVHILSAEGHPGYGVDVRKRNIWDLYGTEAVLKEMTIIPSRESLFPESDWLIGNHSDELTPWIPVMAARSSYTGCYFVLPCCHHDFDSKFSQSVVGGSQYREYLNYIQTVGEECGFVVEEDMLRIPSTKRVCFVGRSRTYAEANECDIDQKRTAFINSRCSQNKTATINSVINSENAKSSPKGDNWSADFEPRSKVETTRNCVTVRKETKEAVIRSVFEKLMSSDTCEVKKLENGRQWRKGGTLPISEVVKLFDGTLLQELKSECGGIQTLLRNSSQIFQVSSGIVQLRDFTLEDPWGRKRKGKKIDNSDFVKTSLCWFNTNHPDGCPRLTESCDYAHSEAELRTRPAKVKKLTP